MNFATHQAIQSDVAFLLAVFLRAMRVHITAARGYWDEAKERDQLQIPHTRIIRQEGASVGFFMAGEHGQEVELHTLCIAPEHQGHGLGTLVIQQLVDDARSRGSGVVLQVLKVNTRAHSLYERLGFVVTGESLPHYQLRSVA